MKYLRFEVPKRNVKNKMSKSFERSTARTGGLEDEVKGPTGLGGGKEVG